MPGKIFFAIQYLLSNPPWDTGITPPEVINFLEKTPPGRALDLGCGTGTNVLTIASYGWQVTGIDYIPQAIRTARRKLHQAGLTDRVDFQVGDVLNPKTIEGEYDLILDIGCFHSFVGADIKRYSRMVSHLLAPGGNFLLYVHLRENPESNYGTVQSDLDQLGSVLTLIHRQDGEESYRPSAWLRFQNS